MNSKRTNNLTNNQQQIDNNGLLIRTTTNLSSNNTENDDPHPNIINNYDIINAAELNLDLLPKKLKNVNNSRPNNTNRTNKSVAAAAVKMVDRNKAREHIAEQQRKRLLEKKVTVSDSHKDEIKKRLAALHQNSLKIVKKNVEKKQKDLTTLVNSTETVVNSARCTSDPFVASTFEKKLATPSKPPSSKFQPINEVQNTEPPIDTTPSKRGILRRKELFDGPPTTHSTPRLDETFLNSLLQTVKQRQSDRHEPGGATPPRIDEKMKLRVPQSELKSKMLSGNSSRSRSKSWDLTRTSNSTSKRSGVNRMRNESKHNIPYWLKPTSAQAYPYNFIMAVRKKLESVTQPILVDPVPIARLKTETPLARPKNSRNAQSSNFRQNLDKAEETNVAHESSKAFLNMIDSIPAIKSINETSEVKLEDKASDIHSHEFNASQSKPVSVSEEFSTNFSSISLHITDRNTMSELSSIRSEQPLNNHTISPSKHIDALSDGDDTTISSAILSHNSPAKKSKPQTFIAAPLSTEAIKDLKICSSNSNLSTQRTMDTSRIHPFANVNTRRGDSDHTNDVDQRSMVEMFETFSKNLSQVISVNERLHNALSTSIHNSNPSVQRNSVSEMKNILQSKSQSLHEYQTDTDPVYTTSFEATNTNDENIQEVEGLNSRTKTETNLQSKNNEDSAKTVKDVSTTKTVSEEKTGTVVVTTTIDTQTVTSQKTHILSNVPTESVHSIDPEFRRYSTASSIIGSDIFAVFSQSDEENSLRAGNQSEESFNYSSIGQIDQLINNEKQKSEHLSKLMKIREKSLIDRTKGQIAWLELQKQKYKEKGLTDRISAVKKKQRALLLHMAAERANILRLNKLQQSPKSQRSPSKFKFQNFTAAEVNVKRTSLGNELNNISQRSAFRAYEINGTQGLEDILRKREEELQKRRNQVEHLIHWHQRLNREEDELLKMERMLMAYTSGSATDQPPNSIDHQINVKSPAKSPPKAPQEIKKIKNIEKSLQLLHNMSSTSVTTNGEEIEDVVEASGNRLNKLWRRLTGDDSDKFIGDQHYKLNKYDLEKMYEDAKNVVVVKFTKNKDIGPLNDLSLSVSVLQASNDQNSIQQDESKNGRMETDELSQSSVIPSLDLNFSQESKTTSVIVTNVEASEGNDNYYFSDVKSQNTSKEGHTESAATINNDQDNTLADTISLDNNTSSPSEHSFNENIDEISFPHLKDVTSLEQTILDNTNDNNNSSVNDSINTIAQITSPSDAIITDNVMAQEFTDNNLSDECVQDNTADDKSVQFKNSSSDDESKSDTKSNRTMFSDSAASEQIVVESNDHASSSDESKSIGLEQRLIDLDDSLKDLSEAIDRAPVMEVNHAEQFQAAKSKVINGDGPLLNAAEEKNVYNEVKMVRNKNINESFPTSEMIIAGKQHDDLYHGSGKSASLIRDYVSPASELKMPDIISEAEVLRRQQLTIEQEIKHIDQSVPVVFRPIDEIPNKPPPPYVPPAHGSPLNTIHPTDERIKEIVYRRIGELYNSISDPSLTEKSQSILSENITNVYERIILDVCKECISELDICDPSTLNAMKFKQRLAFYNPPDRLEYVQEFALKKVKKLLNPNSSSMGQATQIGGCVKRKRDLVDEMLVMEMIEDESKWSNFDLEEKEVIENIVEQVVLLIVNGAVDDAAIWRQKAKATSVLKNVE